MVEQQIHNGWVESRVRQLARDFQWPATPNISRVLQDRPLARAPRVSRPLAYTVSVLMTIGLMQMPKRDVVGTTDIEDLAPVEGGGIEGIVATFDRSVDKVLRDIVVWTIRTAQTVAVS